MLALRIATAVLLTGLSPPAGTVAPVSGPAWSWPVPTPHVIARLYVAPATAYSAGHRGIDLRAPAGTPVTAPDDGVVRFAGRVVDRGVLSIDHGGVLSSLEPVDPGVVVGAHVMRGQVVGVVAAPGRSHPPGVLHLGARIAGGYVSPLLLLGGLRRAVLQPLTLPMPP